MVLLLSYDLNGDESSADYKKVKNVIETTAASSIKPLYSQWLIETSYSVDYWYKLLQNATDSNDALAVTKVDRTDKFFVNDKVHDWLRAHI